MGRPPTIQRQQLLETARRIFAQKGFEAATLADIARELSVTPAALLRHASSKQALFAQSMKAARVAPEHPVWVQFARAMASNHGPLETEPGGLAQPLFRLGHSPDLPA